LIPLPGVAALGRRISARSHLSLISPGRLGFLPLRVRHLLARLQLAPSILRSLIGRATRLNYLVPSHPLFSGAGSMPKTAAHLRARRPRVPK
jgi:hypothetical protein